jgi:hypothetical protein
MLTGWFHIDKKDHLAKTIMKPSYGNASSPKFDLSLMDMQCHQFGGVVTNATGIVKKKAGG